MGKFIELHMLQSFGPSNLNRDDTGAPKDTDFGGVRRARISSQCIKRAVRKHPLFGKHAGSDSVRTRWLNYLLAQAFVQAGRDEAQAAVVANAMASRFSKLDKEHTSTLLFMSRAEIDAIVARLDGDWDAVFTSVDKDGGSDIVDAIAKDMFKRFKGRSSAPDIAMFGRMAAEANDLRLDAAVQVAHAISTHRVGQDIDFFTAVDDINDNGAGMVGVVPFNSACYYRYARVDWDTLVGNLGGDTQLARQAVIGFLHAMITAIPSGKQNSFASYCPPDFILGVARDGGDAWSLANAFEAPVKAGRVGGYVVASIEALDRYLGKMLKVFGGNGYLPYVVSLRDDAALSTLAKNSVDSTGDLVDKLVAGLG